MANKSKTIKLPCYGIKVVVNEHDGLIGGVIQSDLYEEDRIAGKEPSDYVMDGIESMILACACSGIDIETPAFIEAIETSVEATLDNLE